MYASKTAMWTVVADVLCRQYGELMPKDGDGVVDVEKVVDRIDDVYEQGGDEGVLDQLIRESLDQLIEQKMIPDRGEPWTTKA